jgi:hypothetical protein
MQQDAAQQFLAVGYISSQGQEAGCTRMVHLIACLAVLSSRQLQLPQPHSAA